MNPDQEIPAAPIEGTVAHARESRNQTIRAVTAVGSVVALSALIGGMGTSAFQEMQREDAKSNRDAAGFVAEGKSSEVGYAAIGFAINAADLCELAGKVQFGGPASFMTNFNTAKAQLAQAAANYQVIYGNIGHSSPEQRADHAAAVDSLTTAWGNFSAQLGKVARFDGFSNFSVNGVYPNENNAYLMCATALNIQNEYAPNVTLAMHGFRAAESAVTRLAAK